ncbi:hypothetical protein TSAR_012831 [Trichomalopsis sarcophagae]|uniref:Amine oxidase domain-containing protein n=1 Tax=Trichomalopsis sarcophagae TaxID=543379 RepID=A0A232EUS7_9HYME|nr:hypothetical protein TSAR_012831 [Trichomalopsis sarcophagae]
MHATDSSLMSFNTKRFCHQPLERCLTKTVTDKKVELGANWIHGVLGNPIFELAMANDLISITSIPRPHKIVAAMENGKQLLFSVLEEIYAAYVSVGEHIALETDLYLEHLSPEDRKVRQILFDCLLKRETCITGCDSMKDVDLLEMGSYTELQGGNISLPGGYSSILAPVCKHIPKEKILTRHAVTKIRWHNDAEDKSSSPIKVECDNGKVINCEQVICTLPLGVLKACAKDIFEPQLTTHKLEAIDRLMFGTVDKIILEYERPFLNPGVSEIMLLWDDRILPAEEAEDLSKVWFRKIYSFTKLSDTLLLIVHSILAPVCKHIPKEKILTTHTVTKIRWHNDAEDKSSSPIKVECNNGKVINCEQMICTLPLGLTTHKLEAIDRLMFGTVDKIILEYERPFLNPGVSEIMLLWDDRILSAEEAEDLSKVWFRKIYSFTKLSDTLLLGWISGKAAEYMEGLASEEVARVCTGILRSFLNDPFVPAPKACVHTSWHSQPYTRGSYTAMAVGASQLDIECLAEPLAGPESSKLRLAFAGEHTHSSFYSTVHGAYLSGRTAAQAVLESRRWEKQDSVSCDTTSDLSSWIQGIELN